MTRAFVLAAAFAGALAAQPAYAGSIAVSTAGLDLASPAGQAVLKGRVRAAADRLCVVNGIRPLDEVAASQRCVKQAVGSAMTRVAARATDIRAASL